MKGIAITAPFAVNAAEPIDSKYGIYVGASVILCLNAALAAIHQSYRHKGLTIGVELTEVDNVNGVGMIVGTVYEYWLAADLDTFVPKINSTIAGTPTELSAALNTTETAKALQLNVVSEELTLDTNRPITRNVMGLKDEVINVNLDDPAIGYLGKLNAFIQAVFFPFVEGTIGITLTGATLREVGTISAPNVTINAAVTDNGEAVGDRNIFKNNIPLGGVYGALYTWNDVDENAGMNDAGVDTYKVSCNVATTLNGEATKPIDDEKTIEYVFPIFMGHTDAVPADGAAILAAETAATALRTVAKWTGEISFNDSVNPTLRDMWMVGGPRYRWIAIPVSLGRAFTKYSNGPVEESNVPNETGTFRTSGIVDRDIAHAAWGAGAPVAYKLYVTNHDTEFSDSFKLTFDVI